MKTTREREGRKSQLLHRRCRRNRQVNCRFEECHGYRTQSNLWLTCNLGKCSMYQQLLYDEKAAYHLLTLSLRRSTSNVAFPSADPSSYLTTHSVRHEISCATRRLPRTTLYALKPAHRPDGTMTLRDVTIRPRARDGGLHVLGLSRSHSNFSLELESSMYVAKFV